MVNGTMHSWFYSSASIGGFNRGRIVKKKFPMSYTVTIDDIYKALYREKIQDSDDDEDKLNDYLENYEDNEVYHIQTDELLEINQFKVSKEIERICKLPQPIQ